MKLRWQFVLSHLVSILTAAILIGAVHLWLLLRSTRALEQQSLESSLATANHLLLQKIGQLENDRDAFAAFASRARMGTDLQQLARLHELLAIYSVERVEVFNGLNKEAEIGRASCRERVCAYV
jgi:hypothetical protein